MSIPPPPPPLQDATVKEIDANRYGNPSLASGTFGEVSIALYHDDDRCWRYAAVKTIRNATVGASPTFSWGFALDSSYPSPSPSSDRGPLQPQEQQVLTREAASELSALRSLSGNHPCIVPLLASYPSRGGFAAGTGLSLAFPYCPTDLSSALDRRRARIGPGGGGIPDGVVRAAFCDVMSALAHCHANGFVHGDVTPANFVVSSGGRVQLTDFGLAVRLERLPLEREEQQVSSNADDYASKREPHALCALTYRPPEVLLGSTTPHPAQDVWGAGLILAELHNLRSPTFPGRNDLDQLTRIFGVLGTPTEEGDGGGGRWPGARKLPDYGKVHFDPRESADVTDLVPRAGSCPELQALLEVTVALDPAARSTAAACLEHSWFGLRPQAAEPGEVLGELVPEELRVPPPTPEPAIHDTDEGEGLDRAKRRAVAVASARRAAARAGGGLCTHYPPVPEKDATKFQCHIKANGLIPLIQSYRERSKAAATELLD